MKNEIIGIVGNLLLTSNTQVIRDEVTAWVTLIGSVAITLTTIGIQIYHLIRDRDKDTAKAENEEKENKK